jgi:hypothetical protein
VYGVSYRILNRWGCLGTLLIKAEFAEKLGQLARGNGRALSEAARVFAYLEAIHTRIRNGSVEFWNVGFSASGVISSQSRLKNGSLIWRLCPEHDYCIALLAEIDGDIRTLDVCGKEEVVAVELRLCDE